VVFQHIPFGNLLGTAWFGLLFFAGITSSVAMLTPITAFFREEFGFKRETVAWSLGALCLVFGLMHIAWLEHGVLDEWDYWAGTFGLIVVAVMEVILFMWIFTPSKAWESMHQGADLRIPQVFKFIMTYVTPVYLLFILGWWGYVDALPILMYEKSAGGGSLDPANTGYVTISRAIIVLFAIVSVVLIRMAWQRNKYDDRKGFVEVDRSGEGA